MISDFVRLRGQAWLAPREIERLRLYLLDILDGDGHLPSRGRGLDWQAIASGCGVDETALLAARHALRPGLEAMRRELRKKRLRRGLARDRHLTGFPEFERFYVWGFLQRTQGRSPSPLVYQFRHARVTSIACHSPAASVQRLDVHA